MATVVAVVAIASLLASAAPAAAESPRYDDHCRTPTQWRRGTPHRTCAFAMAPDWSARSRQLGELRIANWTLVTGASIFVVGTALLIVGVASNASAPNGRGDDPTFIAAGGATMGAGGLLALIGGIWRIALARRHPAKESAAPRR